VPRPIVYYGNFYIASGTLSGTNTDTASVKSAVRRVADADLSLAYQLVSGDPGAITGVVSGQVALYSDGVVPTGFVMVHGELLSGFVATLWSEDTGAVNPQTHDSRTLTSDAPYHFAISGVSGGTEQWRYSLSGTTSGLGIPHLHELLLGTRYQFPRSPQVNVQRSIVRRFTRHEIPGGQPFVFKQGTNLRETLYTFQVISGTEVDNLRAFVSGVEGGEPFFLVDDLEEAYWAELVQGNVTFSDDFGLWEAQLGFREVKRS
jgi:hypothetical protein